MSRSRQQPNPAVISRRRSRALPGGTLAKVAGAGVGSGLIALVQVLNLSPTMKIAMEAAAPWIAVAVGGIGPYISVYLIQEVRYYGLRRVVDRAKRFAATVPADAPNKAEIDANVQELETMLSDLIRDSASFWHDGHDG
jgi:hypothetical protein